MQRCNGPHPDEKIEFSYKDMHHLLEHTQALINLLKVNQIDWIAAQSVKVGEVEELYEELNKIKDHMDARIFEIMAGDTVVKALHLHRGEEEQ